MLPSNLKYFLAVAKTGSVNGASEQLNVASSAISRQISSLEAKLKLQLFDRGSSGMTLTPAGEKLADYARRALLDSDEVISNLNNMRQDYFGKIRVAVSDGIANALLSEAIFNYRQQHDAIEFETLVVSPYEVGRLVREGQVDVGITFALTSLPPVNIVKRFSMQTVILVHPEHELAQRNYVTLQDIEPYAVALPDAATSLRKIIDIRCAAEGINLKVAMTSPHSAGLIHYARLGGAIVFAAFITGITWVKDGYLVAIPFRESTGMDRSILAITMANRQLPNRISTFIDCIDDCINGYLKIINGSHEV